MNSATILSTHLDRQAVVYVRQSTMEQVHNHLESQRRQYALVERAIEMGWKRPQIAIIDDDLGVSGSGAARTGFDRLVAEVSLGRVGLVLALEVSRLARNNRDWYTLLDLCGIVDTLISDADGLYHPGNMNDRILLGLKGTMSEVELHLIRSRLRGGIWEAARRGELRFGLPIGYEHDSDGNIMITPDEAVKETITAIFRRFEETGSARQVMWHFAEHGLRLPHRDREGAPVSWNPPTYHPIHSILSNPIYAGAYVYGRSKLQRSVDDQGRVMKRVVKRPRGEWDIVIEDHHPAFISFAQYRRNGDRLHSNWKGGFEEQNGAVREGSALLQGLVRCGRCGRKMHVSYNGRRPYYSCNRAQQLYAQPRRCQGLGGWRMEQAVVNAFLEALAPASLEATLIAVQETEQSRHAERRQRQLMVEQAQYEAERARRQFDQVEPENRLVARNLEAAWEQRLTEVRDREAELVRFDASRPTALSEEELAWLRHAGADLKVIWSTPTTTDRDRKQLLRCLIQEVVVTRDRERGIADLNVIWVGGASTRLASKLKPAPGPRRKTSNEVLNLVRRLAPYHSDEQIAFILNREHLVTGHDNSFTRRRVRTLRLGMGIPAGPIKRLTAPDDPDWMSVKEAAAILAVSENTIQRWAREGFLEARQVTPSAPWSVRVTKEVRTRVAPTAPAGWVRVQEAAKHLGRSKQAVLQMVKSGRLRAVHVTAGRRSALRIDLADEGLGLFEAS